MLNPFASHRKPKATNLSIAWFFTSLKMRGGSSATYSLPYGGRSLVGLKLRSLKPGSWVQNPPSAFGAPVAQWKEQPLRMGRSLVRFWPGASTCNLREKGKYVARHALSVANEEVKEEQGRGKARLPILYLTHCFRKTILHPLSRAFESPFKWVYFL